MSRARIGLDIDGVLYQFSKTAQYMIARREGFQYREQLPWNDTQWDCERPQSDWDWVLDEPQADKVFRHGHLYRGAIEFVEQLDELADVYIVTKRPRSGVQATLDFFSFNKLPVSGFHLIGLDQAKSEVNADIFIDDSLDNLDDLADHTTAQLMLIDRPWNQDWNRENHFYKIGRFYRAYNFDHAVVRVERWLTKGVVL